MNIYDEIRYPSRTYVQTHPDTLAAVSALMGNSGVDARRCRVLEIGCGDGANLIAMAASLPQSEFVGVDLSTSAIDDARACAMAVGMPNATFHCADILEMKDSASGSFDFIIAHGVFSWVPQAVRMGILEVCRQSLTPQGIAYISYNAYPGCHLREMTWRMMRHHVRHWTSAEDQIREAQSLLRVLVGSRKDTDEAYHRALVEAADHSQTYNASAFFHDDLSGMNVPYYFHEFIELARQHGLQFLAEAELRAMQLEQDESPAAGILAEMEKKSVLIKEQYLDFLMGRRFRQTLLCREGIPLRHIPMPEALVGLRVASNIIKLQPPDDKSEEDAYTGPKGSELRVTDPSLKDALKVIAAAWPQSVDVGELLPVDEEGRDRLLRFLLKAVLGGAMECRSQASPHPPARRSEGRAHKAPLGINGRHTGSSPARLRPRSGGHERADRDRDRRLSCERDRRSREIPC